MKRLLILLMLTTSCFAADIFDQVKANDRMAKAKTICYSADSTVQWPRNLKSFDSQTVLKRMAQAARIAALGYRLQPSCLAADLVMRIDVDEIAGSAFLQVTDADSGEAVFTQYRTIVDVNNDLYRLAKHFQEARRVALIDFSKYEQSAK